MQELHISCPRRIRLFLGSHRAKFPATDARATAQQRQGSSGVERMACACKEKQRNARGKQRKARSKRAGNTPRQRIAGSSGGRLVPNEQQMQGARRPKGKLLRMKPALQGLSEGAKRGTADDASLDLTGLPGFLTQPCCLAPQAGHKLDGDTSTHASNSSSAKGWIATWILSNAQLLERACTPENANRFSFSAQMPGSSSLAWALFGVFQGP